MRGSILLSVALATATGAPAAQEALPEWLVGSWCDRAPQPGQVCERWSSPADGRMRGTTTTIFSGRPDQVEPMEIAPVEGKLAFIASPPGQARTVFPLVSAGSQQLVFENRAHDYPQRIRYWREGEVLMAEISLSDGSKPMRWRYTRAE